MDILKRLIGIFTQPNKGSVFLYIGDKKALYITIIIPSVMMLPLAIKNYFFGYHLLASTLLLFFLTSTFHIWAIYKKSPLILHPHIIAILLILSLFFTVHYLGVSTIYWCYPISIALLFMLPLKSAFIFNIIVWSIISGFSFIEMPLDEALRISTSLLLTIIISGSVLMHINQLNKRLLNEIIRDPMTGAYNRKELSFHLKTCLKQQKEDSVHSALLFIDIDHFKAVNDSFGHDVGDDVIKELVNIITNHSRETDKVFRIGGEEFVLLMHNTNIKNALRVADKLRLKIKNEQIIENYPITVSIGVCSSENNPSKDQWLKFADIALYEAKEAGRDNVKLYRTSKSQII